MSMMKTMTIDLMSFIDDNPMIDLNTACDFVCERYDINLTDDLIEDISEIYFSHPDVQLILGLAS